MDKRWSRADGHKENASISKVFSFVARSTAGRDRLPGGNSDGVEDGVRDRTNRSDEAARELRWSILGETETKFQLSRKRHGFAM
jgi:hypothetical protein